MASPEDTAASASAPPRPKVARTNTGSGTTGAVRARPSPPPGEQNGDGRPPTKRARKAINCEPCRNSKLKCDRNRPCSSCVLRGTSALCYQDGRGHESSDPVVRGDDPPISRIDPAQEIARLRHSITLLEAHIFPAQRAALPPAVRRHSDASILEPKKEHIDHDVNDKNAPAPGVLGSSGQGGLYAGPTSAATHLLINGASSEDGSEGRPDSQDRLDDFPSNPEYDRDLLAMLPSLEIIDGLINYYFEYCNWIYRHINQPAFRHNWDQFKNGSSADRVVLATVCIIMAVSVHYLPLDHRLLASFQESHEEIGSKLYEISRTSLQRRTSETKKYTLELVELMLLKTHFLSLAKTDTEEIWQVKGELVTTGVAMGLHRDPGKWRMHRDTAERRRWAWWHIILLERWQSFLFGRPLSIASHHFDTQLPSYCDPAIDKSGRLYLPNIALFRLAYILGDILDDAISVRPVSYESVQTNDRALTRWMDDLPPELDLDEYRVARNLASPNTAILRLGVQSVIIRTSYYHIRFTLHRPYASAATAPQYGPAHAKTAPAIDAPKTAQSLEIAVSAADKLITMVGQSRPDFLANSSLAVPGHMNWGPFHCFSAAMFFSFQLIANPDQPGAGLFRASIRKAMGTLEQCRGTPLADKSYDILHTLSPLYSVEFQQESGEHREKLQSQVLSAVRKLAFPYHDSHDPRRFADSPHGRGSLVSPASSSSMSPPLGLPLLPTPYDALPGTVSVRTPAGPAQLGMYPPPPPGDSPHSQGQLSPAVLAHPQSLGGTPGAAAYPPLPYTTVTQQQAPYADAPRYAPYVHPIDEATMWGASVGFGQAEWAQFLNGLQPQRAEVPPSRHGP